MQRHIYMKVAFFLLGFLAAATPAAAEATLFRVFLVDGTSVVSYGEMARVNDQVIFSMPVGGTAEDPRLHAVTLASALVDWPRTDRYATSARYRTYFESGRAEDDYQRLTGEVAAVLNQIARSTDRDAAIALADQARKVLVDWPRRHFGHRQSEVRDIVTLLDQSISTLRGSARFELSLFASPDPPVLEPLAVMPSTRDQLDQILRVLRLTTTGRDRIALLQSALTLVNEAGNRIEIVEGRAFRRSLERELKRETEIDARYARLTKQVFTTAARAASDARIADVERALDDIAKQDAKLGGRRPEMIQAARIAVEQQLDRARRLRLLRDQWQLRQRVYRDYQSLVGSQIVQLVKAQSALESIRRLDGPAPDRVRSLYARLAGGADRLQRVPVAEYLRPTHELLVSAWRFAETAAKTRYDAIATGSLPTAWEASSAAAGSLLMLSRAQQELRTLLEPPRLQ